MTPPPRHLSILYYVQQWEGVTKTETVRRAERYRRGVMEDIAVKKKSRSGLCADVYSDGNWLFEKRIASELSTSLGEVKWLTTSEAAHYLRVSVGSIKNMVYRGQLRPRKLGRLNRFLKDELDRLIKFSPLTKGDI